MSERIDVEPAELVQLEAILWSGPVADRSLDDETKRFLYKNLASRGLLVHEGRRRHGDWRLSRRGWCEVMRHNRRDHA